MPIYRHFGGAFAALEVGVNSNFNRQSSCLLLSPLIWCSRIAFHHDEMYKAALSPQTKRLNTNLSSLITSQQTHRSPLVWRWWQHQHIISYAIPPHVDYRSLMCTNKLASNSNTVNDCTPSLELDIHHVTVFSIRPPARPNGLDGGIKYQIIIDGW